MKKLLAPILEPIQKQLKQGITPHKLSLTVSIGIAIALFPIIGTTTALCLLLGYALKLNHPILQAINYLLYPLQIALVLVFIRLGEWLFSAPPISLSPLQLKDEFMQDPGEFLRNFGATGFHAVIAWALIAPFFAAAMYAIFFPIFKRSLKTKK